MEEQVVLKQPKAGGAKGADGDMKTKAPTYDWKDKVKTVSPATYDWKDKVKTSAPAPAGGKADKGPGPKEDKAAGPKVDKAAGKKKME